MSEGTTSAPAPSTPSASAPSSTPSAAPAASSTPSSPTRSTTAELSQKLFAPREETGTAASDLGEVPDSSPSEGAEAPWHEQYAEGIHGVPVQELLRALSGGQLPEALYKKLRMELRDGDHVWESDIEGMRNGSQMQQVFTRKTQELAQERNAFHAERDELTSYLRNWKSDPQQLLHGLERLGMPILESAQLLAQRLTKAEALNQAFPGSGDEWLESVRSQSELADLRRAQERQAQAQNQQQSSQKQAQVRANLQKASKEIFTETGLKLEKSSWDVYTQHVQAILDTKDGKSLTRQDLRQAAAATKQQFDAYARTYLSSQKKEAPGAKLGLTSLDPGAPKGVPARAPKPVERKTTEQVMAEMRNRGGFGQR